VKREDDTWEDTPPDPGATIESLRSLGYTPGAAVADLIDNSISAGSKNVTVVAKWARGGDAWLAIVDDGEGMTEERLRQAMRIGSRDPLDARTERDLGRFGFGLKTASFSQARELIVVTRRAGSLSWVARTWDLDHVRQTGRWSLRRSAPTDAEAIVSSLPTGSHGTAVVWRRLTGFVDQVDNERTARRAFQRQLEEVSAHLGMVFARHLASGQLRVGINRHNIRAWDPFLAGHTATQELPAETLRLRSHEVLVTPYVLPHDSKLAPAEVTAAAGPAGWNEQQGFYIYRKDRMITSGDWLGLGIAREDLHNLARLAVDVPADLDAVWQLDIRKAVVRPPDGLRADLLRIARFTRQKAASVQRHRGTPVTRKARTRVDQLWVQKSRHGRQLLTINRKHPLVAHLLAAPTPKRREITDLLLVIEQTIPVLLLPAERAEELPLEDQAPDDIIRLAELAYETLLSGGLSRAEARQRLMHTEPFHHYPELVRMGIGDTVVRSGKDT